MPVEIERRFLVRDPCAAIGTPAASSFHITQGYFGQVDGLRVRVRVVVGENNDRTAILTFKGARRGYCRLEYEYPLDIGRAWRALHTLPPMEIIQKTRYQIPSPGDLVWSVDQFEGANQGLFVAEIELSHPNQKFALPPWAGEEITFDPRYGNSRLARSPMPHPTAGAQDGHPAGLCRERNLCPAAPDLLRLEFLMGAASDL
jgi:CYTH domain-containing protein